MMAFPAAFVHHTVRAFSYSFRYLGVNILDVNHYALFHIVSGAVTILISWIPTACGPLSSEQF